MKHYQLADDTTVYGSHHARAWARFALLATLCASSSGCSGVSSDEATGAIAERSICGGVVDWQNVETYDGSLGPSVAFVNAHQGPVGYLGNGCSGTLIGPDLFLTAGHCMPYTGTVAFNFQLDPSGNQRPTDVYNISSVLEDDIGGVDYAIVQLDANAGSVWGITVPSALLVPNNEPITIIQHPAELPKKIEGGTLQYQNDGRIAYDDLDTIGGSSGSGILQNLTGLLIGVHTDGVSDQDCGPGDPNRGWSIANNVYAQSPIMRQRALDPAKLTAVL